MPIDIGGTTVAGAATGQTLKVAYGATDILKVDSTGRTTLPNTIGFIAGGTATGWQAYSGANPLQMTCYNTTVLNVGGCYNTTTSTFTAPVNGTYMFMSSMYHYTGPDPGYVEMSYYVNGSVTARRPAPFYRIRGYCQPTTYSEDSQMEEIVYLYANDYIQIYHWWSSGTQYYPIYSVFSGFLLG